MTSDKAIGADGEKIAVLRRGLAESELIWAAAQRRRSGDKMRTSLILMLSIALAVCACQDDKHNASGSNNSYVKISVLQSGKLLIDGTESTIAQVEQRLAQLKSEDGSVWYYREAGQQEPPPEAMQVIKIVVEKELPITLSSKPDFSDYIDENGQSHPRD